MTKILRNCSKCLISIKKLYMLSARISLPIYCWTFVTEWVTFIKHLHPVCITCKEDLPNTTLTASSGICTVTLWKHHTSQLVCTIHKNPQPLDAPEFTLEWASPCQNQRMQTDHLCFWNITEHYATRWIWVPISRRSSVQGKNLSGFWHPFWLHFGTERGLTTVGNSMSHCIISSNRSQSFFGAQICLLQNIWHRAAQGSCFKCPEIYLQCWRHILITQIFKKRKD